MAKITGPFHSDDASGTFGKILTASKWKGRAYMRMRVIPANPKTAGQKSVRSILGTLAKACAIVLTSRADTLGVGSQFFIDTRDSATTGQSWISYLQKVMNSLFASNVTAYGLLTATIKGYFNTNALSAGLSDYVDKSNVTHTAGEQLYMLASFAVNKLNYTGFAGGLSSATNTEVEDFVDYVKESV